MQIGGQEWPGPRQIHLEAAGQIALADLRVQVADPPDLALANQLAFGLQPRQLGQVDPGLAQDPGQVGAVGRKLGVNALQPLRIVDPAGCRDPGLPGSDVGIDRVARLGQRCSLRRPGLHVERHRLALEAAPALEGEARQAIMQARVQLDVLELEVGSGKVADRVVEISAEPRQAVRLEPARHNRSELGLARLGLGLTLHFTPGLLVRARGRHQRRQFGRLDLIRMQRGADRRHVLAEIERDLAGQIARAELQVDGNRNGLGRVLELRDRRTAQLQMQGLTFEGTGRGQRHAVGRAAVRTAGAAPDFVQVRDQIAAAAVIEIADRGSRDPELADLRDRRRALRGTLLELPIGWAVGARLQPEHGPRDADLSQHEPAVQQCPKIDHELGPLDRQHRAIARPLRIGKTQVPGDDPRVKRQIDVERPRDLELAPQRRRDPPLQRPLEPVPVEQGQSDQGGEHGEWQKEPPATSDHRKPGSDLRGGATRA